MADPRRTTGPRAHFHRGHPGLLAAACVLALATGCGGPNADAGPPTDPCADHDGGEGSYCLSFGPIEVSPGTEWQGYRAVKLPDASHRSIVGLEVEQLGGDSHHFIVGTWTGEAPPITDVTWELLTPNGLVVAGQTRALVGSIYKHVDIDTGDFVGVELDNDYLVLNGHYINTGSEPIHGLTRIIVETRPSDEIDYLAYPHLPGTTDIHVPPGEVSSSTATWRPETDVAVLLLTTHMHRHGIGFEIFSVIDGTEEKVFETDDWEAPPPQIFTGPPNHDPLVLRPERGDHLWFKCTWRNHDLDEPLTWGERADTGEMCIMPLYYLPDPDPFLDLLEQGVEGTAFTFDVTPYEYD